MKVASFDEVLSFWFDEIESSKWWLKNQEFDRLIASRFGSAHLAASHAELFQWRSSAQGRLAEIIVLDQFSRNIFRDKKEAFAFDAQALTLAQEAVLLGVDKELPSMQTSFMYMPYMHSESAIIHQHAVKLFESIDSPKTLEFELKHKHIIDRFGRYPHRNKVLARVSTKEEIAFLKEENSSF
ncbi:MAG: DUF924 domain-containing protein [Acidiferrobacterales bacterium]|nr:DUF924 domain-containing protein [Acidiferrobacterales bacterium]